MANEFPEKIKQQIANAGLPLTGNVPFEPRIRTNRRGQKEIKKAEVKNGPKKGHMGYVDLQGRIWVKDHAHSGKPEHWDVQIDGGKSKIDVDLDGNLI